MATPFSLSKDGIEMQFATNHVGHFLLTHLLLETMKKTSRESNVEGRIVNVSSEGHRFAYPEGVRFDKINNEAEYGTIAAYGQSKLANILHANELARRFKAYTAVNVDLDKFQKKHDSFSKKMARSYEKFEFNPASWWRLYGGAVPDLQRMAIRILSLTSSSSGCERNWSTFEAIHTKKRNRLTTERMDMLSNIQFNNRMLNKKERISRKKSYEVLLASDASEAQGFLFEGGDAHALMVFHDPDEGFVPGTTIPWQMLGEAVGADEVLQPRRSSRGTRELNEEEWESAQEDGEEDDIAYEDEDGDEDEIREVCGFV